MLEPPRFQPGEALEPKEAFGLLNWFGTGFPIFNPPKRNSYVPVLPMSPRTAPLLLLTGLCQNQFFASTSSEDEISNTSSGLPDWEKVWAIQKPPCILRA
jgi:hypothetical protein